MNVSAVLASNITRTFVCASAVSETAVLAARSHGDLAIPANPFSLVLDRSHGFDPSEIRRPKTLFDLPPMSERYLTGLLAITGSRQTIFGVSTYLGAGHRGLITAVERTFGEANLFLWGGEIQVRRGVLGAQVVAFNQTSGELYRRQEVEKKKGVQNLRVRNTLSDIRRSLARQSPVRIAAHAKLVPFTRKEQHLHPWLAGYGKNFRHDLKTAFFLNSTIVPENKTALQHKGTPEWDLRDFFSYFTDLETFARLIEENDTFHPLDGNWFPRTFGSFLRFASGVQPSKIPLSLHLRQYIEKIQRGESLSLEDYEGLTSVLDALWQFFAESIEGEAGNVYDLYQIA